MNKPKQTIFATALIALFALYNIYLAASAIATQNENVQANGNGFIAFALIYFTVCLVSAIGVLQEQKWGKILAIVTLGLNSFFALLSLFDSGNMKALIDVSVFIVVTVLLLRRPKEISAACK